MPPSFNILKRIVKGLSRNSSPVERLAAVRARLATHRAYPELPYGTSENGSRITTQSLSNYRTNSGLFEDPEIALDFTSEVGRIPTLGEIKHFTGGPGVRLTPLGMFPSKSQLLRRLPLGNPKLTQGPVERYLTRGEDDPLEVVRASTATNADYEGPFFLSSHLDPKYAMQYLPEEVDYGSVWNPQARFKASEHEYNPDADPILQHVMQLQPQKSRFSIEDVSHDPVLYYSRLLTPPYTYTKPHELSSELLTPYKGARKVKGVEYMVDPTTNRLYLLKNHLPWLTVNDPSNYRTTDLLDLMAQLFPEYYNRDVFDLIGKTTGQGMNNRISWLEKALAGEDPNTGLAKDVYDNVDAYKEWVPAARDLYHQIGPRFTFSPEYLELSNRELFAPLKYKGLFY